MTAEITNYVLLGPAALLLRSYGYQTDSAGIGGGATLLLAENDYFALGVAEFEAPAHLSAVEEACASALAKRISTEAGPKRWDAYLILLSTTVQDDETMPEAVANIVYNTRFFRRLVRWSVAPESNSLERALRPFLPFTAAQAGLSTGPVDRLKESMASYGVSRDEADHAIALWRATRGVR